MYTLLINRNFAQLWFHNITKILNERFRELIIPIVVLGLTQSPLATALVMLSQQLGAILLAIPVGTWVENKNLLKVARTSQFLYACLVFLLAYFIAVETVHALFIAVLLFVMGIVGLVHGTAFQTMVPRVVGRKRLLSAHNLLETADAIVTLIGPALGGILLARYGASPTLMICGLLLFTSVIFLNFVRAETVVETRDAALPLKKRISDFWLRSQEGVQYLFANSAQKAAICTAVALGFTTVFMSLSVIFHGRTTLGFNEAEIGLLLSCAGIGNIIGVLIMKRFKQVNWLYFLTGLLIVAGLGASFLLVPVFVVMCVGMILFDGALSMGFVAQITVQQGITPDSALARVRSATTVISGVVTLCATFLSGLFAEWNSYIALGFGASMLVSAGFFILKYKKSGIPLDQIKPINKTN